MELGGEYVLAPNGRSKGVSILGACGDDRGIKRLRKEAVNKIDIASVGNAAVERTAGLRQFELVPANLRNFQTGLLGKTDHPAVKYAQPGRAAVELIAPLEQRLVADTNAQERPAGLNELAGGVEQLLFLERGDAVIKGAD